MTSKLRHSTLAVLAVLLAGLAVSTWSYYADLRRDNTRAQTEFSALIGRQADAIASRFARSAEALENLGDLLALHPDMDAATFHAFAARVLARHPCFEAVLWAPVVSGQGDAITIRYQESSGAPFDLSTPARFSALERPLARARSTGMLSVSGLFFARDKENLLALIHPVPSLAAHGPAATQPSGYLLALCAPVRVAGLASGPAGEWALFDQSATDPARHVLLTLNQGGPPPTAGLEDDPAWHAEKLIVAADRSWLLTFRPDPAVFAHPAGTATQWKSGGILAVSLLLAAFVWERSSRRRLVGREAERRTRASSDRATAAEEALSQSRKIEEDLRISEQTLQSLMENSPGAIYVKDLDGRYVAVNRRFLELHGRSRENFIGRSDFELFPPELAARVRKSDAQVVASAEPIEMEESFQLIDGTHVNLVHKFPLIDAAGTVHGVCAIASDITERKRAEAEVRESRRQLESLLGQLPGMAFRYSPDGKLAPVYVSRGASGLTGYTARDFLEKHISLEEIIHPEDRPRVRSAIAAAVKKRRSFEIEYRLIDRAGREKWVLERGQGVHDEQGSLLFIEGLAIDITQRKDAESEKLLVERRLLEGQKLESIGVLAGGIAHDFNNLLTGIIGNANLASLDLPSQSPIRANLRQIENASQRAAELCQQMLAYAGKGRFIVQQVEIGQLVVSTVPLLQASISKRAKLRFDLQPELPAVMSDPTQMRQIIMNLVLNASEALGDKDGEIAITTNLVRPAADWFENAVLAPPETSRDFVRLEVRDTGSGMTPETVAKIFEPFFTTKFTGRGLGLAAVLGIIRSHQGGLIVRSVVGRGSIFALFFPAASTRPVETTASRVPTNTPWQRTGRILVVDDEPHVLKVASGMLTTWGLSVQVANDGYEALDFFRADPDHFDLILLDMTMPRLSGEETLAQLREIRPTVPVLFMSGYNRREVVDALPGRNLLGFIQKPFTLRTLRENLQQMLG